MAVCGISVIACILVPEVDVVRIDIAFHAVIIGVVPVGGIAGIQINDLVFGDQCEPLSIEIRIRSEVNTGRGCGNIHTAIADIAVRTGVCPRILGIFSVDISGGAVVGRIEPAGCAAVIYCNDLVFRDQQKMAGI